MIDYCRMIRKADMITSRRYELLIRDMDITVSQYYILLSITEGCTTMEEISKSLGCAKISALKGVKVLSEKGMVITGLDKKKNAKVRLHKITKEGTSIVNKVKKLIDGYNENISQHCIARASDILEKLNEIMISEWKSLQ